MLQRVDHLGEHLAAATGFESGFSGRFGELTGFIRVIGSPGEPDQDAIEDFGGGVTGEGHRQHLRERNTLKQSRDVPVGQLVGLTGTGRGADQHAFIDRQAVHDRLQCPCRGSCGSLSWQMAARLSANGTRFSVIRV